MPSQIKKILYTLDFTPSNPPELKNWALMIRKLYEQLARSYNEMVDVVNACECSGGSAVSSVFGRTGAVTAQTGDYTVSEVTGAAPLASPALTGSPTAPTQTFGDNTTKIATDAFVQAAVAAVTPPVTSVFGRTGAVVAASADYAVGQVTGAAPLASPTLTGTPTAPTPSTGDNSTEIATTAFVKNQGYVTAATAPVTSVAGKTGAVTLVESDIANLTSDLALKAPLASPAFTGTPTAPKPSAGTNNTQLATASFVSMQLLAISTPSGTGTVSFTSIPSGYRDLLLVIRGQGSQSSTFTEYDVTVNNDGGNNYDQNNIIFQNGTQSGNAGVAAVHLFAGWVPAASGVANASSGGRVTIYNYADTTFQKSFAIEAMVKTANTTAGLFTLRGDGWWRSTSAINRVDVILASGNWIAGSVLSLYGIN